MDRRIIQTIIPSILLAILLVLFIPAVATSHQLTISVQTHWRYFSHEIGSDTMHASFYLFGGGDIEWWQGGAVFVYTCLLYTSPSPRD